MQQASGVLNAIRELEKEAKKIQEAIRLLKRFHSQRSAGASLPGARPSKRLSPAARRRISEAAKKRWTEYRDKKAKAAK